jgi:tetratricopeptide (TPR) repeat protein
MKDKKGLLSPLFLKYQAEYEKNPKSRVFAPLAEMYRKIGMADKAMEILARGIKFHPSYVLGYLGMASCYYDIQQFSLAYSTLKPFIEHNRDNLRLQRLFADSCVALGKKEEALDTYKYLLFILPKDKEVAELVTKIEEELHNLYKPIHRPITIPESNILNERLDEEEVHSPQSKIIDLDSWVQLPLNDKAPIKTDRLSVDPLDWEMQKTKTVFENIPEEVKPEERKFSVVLDLSSVSENVPPSKEATNTEIKLEKTEQVQQVVGPTNKRAAPIITHTLVDLYIGQGHIEKALELLEKILLLNPNDIKTHDKIIEINQLLQDTIDSEESNQLSRQIDLTEQVTDEVVELDAILNPTAKPKVEIKKVELKNVELQSEEEGHQALMAEISQLNVDLFLESEPTITKEEKSVTVVDNNRHSIIEKQELILSSFLVKIRQRAEKFKNL